MRLAAARLLIPRNLIAATLGTGLVFVLLGALAREEYAKALEKNVWQLPVATCLVSLAVLGWGVNWVIVLRGLDQRVGMAKGLSIFVWTWLGRYVPGTVPYHAARILLAPSLGTDRRVVATSVAYETVLLLGSGVLVGCLLLSTEAGGGLVYLLTGVSFAALPLLLAPRVLLPIANRGFHLLRRPGIDPTVFLPVRRIAPSFLGYAAVHVLNGLSFVLVLSTLSHGAVSPVLAIGAYTLAGVTGSAVPFVPSGLGVREGVLVGLLSGALPAEDAVLAAGIARALSVIADLLPIAVLAAFHLGTHIVRLVEGRERVTG